MGRSVNSRPARPRWHQAVNEDYAPLSFTDPPLRLEQPIRRADFETWIARPLATIAECADRTLEAAGVVAADVDRVFMTGGSSFVPAVRRIFETRFGAERLRGGGEFVSVARGLALHGLVRRSR